MDIPRSTRSDMTRTSKSVACSTASASLGEKSPAEDATLTSSARRRRSDCGEGVSPDSVRAMLEFLPVRVALSQNRL